MTTKASTHTREPNSIVCEECGGTGSLDDEGRFKDCPVCDGGKTITFADHKEYARQIDALVRQRAELLAALNSILNEAEHAMIHGESYTALDFSNRIAAIFRTSEAAIRRTGRVGGVSR